MNASRPPSVLRGDLSASTRDAVSFSVMVGFGECYVPAFALALGMGEVVAGLLASVPIVVGAAIQMVTPAAVTRLGSIRRWVVAAAVVQAAAFAPLVAGALLGTLPVLALFAAVSVYWGAGLATGPAWNTWMESLVPRRIRARYFALRSRLAHAAVLVALVAAGLVLDLLEGGGAAHLGFAAVFGVAAIARGASARYLSLHSEPDRVECRVLGPREMLGRMTSRSAGILLSGMVFVQLAVYLSAPYFTPYMLGPLALSYGGFTVLTAAAFLARVATLPLCGRLAERIGPRRLLLLGGFGLAPVSALWTVSDSFAYLLALQVAAGIAWGAYELATFLLFFETIPRHERLSVLTTFNLANAGSMVAGTLLGGALFAFLGGERTAYFQVFALSSLLRVLAVLALLRVPEIAVRVKPLATRTLGVRPGGGVVERPVLSSIVLRALGRKEEAREAAEARRE